MEKEEDEEEGGGGGGRRRKRWRMERNWRRKEEGEGEK
jgi:hypothetical protein